MTTTFSCDTIKPRKQPMVVKWLLMVSIMTKQKKIYIASTFTVLAAFATLLCLFAINGITFTTAVALMAAAFFAQLTVSFFKVENLLRAKLKAEKRQNIRRKQLSVVSGNKEKHIAA